MVDELRRVQIVPAQPRSEYPDVECPYFFEWTNQLGILRAMCATPIHPQRRSIEHIDNDSAPSTVILDDGTVWDVQGFSIMRWSVGESVAIDRYESELTNIINFTRRESFSCYFRDDLTGDDGELVLYGSRALPVVFIDFGDGSTIYTWAGEPVAYLDEASVYSFSGEHLGWYREGTIYDHEGNMIASSRFVKPASPTNPLHGLRALKPLKGLKELKPLKPLFGLMWADSTPVEFFKGSARDSE